MPITRRAVALAAPAIGPARVHTQPGFPSRAVRIIVPNTPAGLAPALLARLNADCVAALRRPEVVARHRTLGAETATGTPDEARRFCHAEPEQWGSTARAAGIQSQ